MNKQRLYKLYKSLDKWQIKIINEICGKNVFEDFDDEFIQAIEEYNKEKRREKIAASMPNKKAVLQYNAKGLLIGRYESTGEASRQTGIATPKIIAKCCRGERKQVGGYTWKYESK